MTFTVISLYETTGEIVTEDVNDVADAHEAFQVVAGCRDDPANLLIVCAISWPTRDLVMPCEDTGKAAYAIDLLEANDA